VIRYDDMTDVLYIMNSAVQTRLHTNSCRSMVRIKVSRVRDTVGLVTIPFLSPVTFHKIME